MDKGIRIFTARKISAFNESYKFPLAYKEYRLYLEIIAPESENTLS